MPDREYINQTRALSVETFVGSLPAGSMDEAPDAAGTTHSLSARSWVRFPLRGH